MSLEKLNFNKSEIPNRLNYMKYQQTFKSDFSSAVSGVWVTGVDFQESFALIINDVNLQILLVIMRPFNLIGKVINTEMVFLHGELEKSICIEIPKGMAANKNKCLILRRTIYGLVQSTR